MPETETFPIQSPFQYLKRADRHPCITGIPWEMIGPHEAQAMRNHSQTLTRLAERAGLSPCEALAVLEDRKWQSMDALESCNRLAFKVMEWKINEPA